MFTAIFLGCLAVSAVVIAFGAISDATGADMPGYSQPVAPPIITAPPAVTDPVVMSTEKKNLTPNGEAIIGLKDPSLTINATGTLTTTTFDTTTYGDRAVIKLTNATGSSIDLTGMCIKGNPVMQLSGQNGYVWEYSDYDSIEKEGEQFVEVSNDFIFDPVQAKQIGDFVWKELKPHKLYSLMLVGCQYQYEIGDVYHLTLTHTMNGGTMENIDTDVEVMGVSINRSVGGVGMTNLNLRVPSEAWALTLAKNSKLVGAGNAQRLNNRSNVVTIASSTWTGQADYFCDGTDDNVEIQAAIDYIESLGGGEVLLSQGSFYISSTIIIKSNIIMQGHGEGTKIEPSIFAAIDWGATPAYGSMISNFSIHGSSGFGTLINGRSSGSATGISIYDLACSGTSYIFSYFTSIINCNVTNSDCITAGYMYCFNYCTNILGCNASYSDGFHVSFSSCKNVSACSVNNTHTTFRGTTSGGSIAFSNCQNVSSCSSFDNDTDYAFTSYYQCKRLGFCDSNGNHSGPQGVGYSNCNSVQQCNSTGDGLPYLSSYADSGTSNACADTAAGGYNS